MNATINIPDSTRAAFLSALARAELPVTEWEAGFLRSFQARPEALWAWFSDKRRAACDEMMRKYADRLPVPASPSPGQRRDLPPAIPGECQYFVYREGVPGRHRCGRKDIAERTRLGAEYCAEHARLRAEFARRQREIMARRLR